jgi:hypothetical protein
MIKPIALIIFIFSICSTVCNAATKESEKDEIIKISSYEVKASVILRLSIEAINKCIENISKGIKDPNFPVDPYRFSANCKEFTFNKFAGYKTGVGKSDSEVLFFIVPDEIVNDVTMAVVIDIAKMKVIKVFVYP